MLDFLTRKMPENRLNGVGIISETIYPDKTWRVEFQATYWFARSTCSMTFKPEDFVRVVGMDVDDLTLLIEPMNLSH